MSAGLLQHDFDVAVLRLTHTVRSRDDRLGFAIRGGGVLDGTEVLALALSRRFSFSIGDIILVINLFIFSAAAFELGTEAALYSVLTYLAASKTVDFIVHGIEEYMSVMIISPKNNDKNVNDFAVHIF